MPEVIIKYKNSKTLQVLKEIAKFFNFKILDVNSGESYKKVINGVTVISGDSSIDATVLEEVFTDQKIDAKTLRSESWQRKV